jgi:hypothetical protein
VSKTERIANGDHEVPHPGLLRVCQFDLGEAFRLDLDDGDVGRRIGADDLRRIGPVVLQRDGDLLRVLDDVGIRDDEALLRVDNDARSGALGLAAPRLVGFHLEKPPEEWVVEERIPVRPYLDATARGDVDDCGCDPLDHRGKGREFFVTDLDG